MDERPNDIDDETYMAAVRWLHRKQAGKANERAFRRWLAEKPENDRAYIFVSNGDRFLDRIKGKLPDDLFDFGDEDEVEPNRRKFFIAAAAVTGFGVLAGGATYVASTSRAEASTRVGQRNSLPLPDGGQVELNTDSKVYWRFDKKTRRIWLDRGEIALSVPKDTRLCVLSGGNSMVYLDAGNFNVRLRKKALDVLVIDGRCAVGLTGNEPLAHAPPQSVVDAGQSAVVEDRALKIKPVTNEEIEAMSAWKSDEVVFDGTPLVDAVEEYNRYLTTKIVIGDPELNSLKILGRFTTRNPTDFLNGLKASYGLTITNSDTGAIVITK